MKPRNPENNSDYSPFHPELDQQCPIDNLLSEKNKKAVISGYVNDLGWVSVFRSSPLQNSESEMIMGMFITEAIRAGQWIDIPLKSDVQKLGFTLKFDRATEMMVDNGFAIVREEGNGKRWLAPTPRLVEFVAERLRRFGPKSGTATDQPSPE